MSPPLVELQVVSMYLWLSNRFDSELFPSRDHAEKLSERYISLMDAGLKAMYGENLLGISEKVNLPKRENDVARGKREIDNGRANPFRSPTPQRSSLPAQPQLVALHA
jgi:hypothetical protein